MKVTRSSTVLPIASAAAPSGQAVVPARTRLQSVDILRGLVVALMALDHTRDFFSTDSFNPRDVSDPALFLTRWITHLCAPTFIFLAGLSAYLYGRGRPLTELSRFLFFRGLWLILIEFTLVRVAWTFDLGFADLAFAGVIWVIGASMIVLAALVNLPRWGIVALALAMIAGHNLLDGIRAQDLGAAGAVWHMLHEPGRAQLGATVGVYVLYPLIPWIGVMIAGYALGPVMLLEPKARQRVLVALGAGVTFGFVALRATNLYGDPAPWTVQEMPLSTVLSFVNCEKYPPSLLFLMMTLGPALMLLAAFEHAWGQLAGRLATFGQVPFFFYVAHIYLIHALAVATGFAMTGALASRPELGLSLASVYPIWLLVLVLLYPLCLWFGELKERRTEWWWPYL
jgi:uncharacterized membrane protein